MMLGCLEVKRKKQYNLASAVIPVFWLAGYLHSSSPNTNHQNSRGMWPLIGLLSKISLFSHQSSGKDGLSTIDICSQSTLKNIIFFRFCSCRNEKKMVFSILVSFIKNPYLRWLSCTETQDNVFNLEKNYVFPKFPFFLKKWPFFRAPGR